MKLSTQLRFAPLLAALAVGMGLVSYAEDARAIGQATGRITGVVTEAQTQAPVPGATVTVTGGQGVNRKAQTQEDGSFEVGPLPPETYDLVVSYEGMKPLKRRVVVNADQTTPLKLVWSAESTAEETTVVEEERHLTNPDSP